MTDKEKATLQITSALLSNSWYVHDKIYKNGGLAKNAIEDAKVIVEKLFEDRTPTA